MTTIRHTLARTFLVELICDCGAAMEFEGIVLNSYPPQYPHRCRSCGAKATESRHFPHYAHEPVGVPK